MVRAKKNRRCLGCLEELYQHNLHTDMCCRMANKIVNEIQVVINWKNKKKEGFGVCVPSSFSGGKKGGVVVWWRDWSVHTSVSSAANVLWR